MNCLSNYKTTWSLAVLLLISVSSLVPQYSTADRLYGLESMERLDLLPLLREGAQVRQVSSHDRSGANNDGFDGEYSALYIDENNEYVMFDEIGSGCLYRFWMTYGTSPTNYPTYRLRFYFDNETTPRLDLSISEFFDGIGAPLEFPMVGPFDKSSHGCYCYLPFPYRERLKITLSGLPLFYNMTYHRFDSSEGVVSWTGSEDRSDVMAQWNTAGSDPKPATSNLVVSGNMPITTGATGTLFSASGKGAVQSIKLDPSPSSTNILSDVWIQMNWDGGELEVDVPLGDFFGSGKYEINMTSLPIGMKTSGDWYCYFPMPYWETAEIRLVNKSSEPLSSLPFEIQYSTNGYEQARTGYFHVHFSEETFVDNGRDFNFIDEQGRGHVVGVSLFMESAGARGYLDMNYLEGDERAYVDGSLSPCIQGTGNEDYFNCGWYFNMGRFSLPYHGHPWMDHYNLGETNYTQAYRLHITDSIPFNKSVKFGIEHGHWTQANASPGTFSSVTYYYKMGGSSSSLALVADLDLGDDWTEELYNYQHPSGRVLLSNTWTYEGETIPVSLRDEGYAYSGSIAEFTVPLMENSGLLLRRRTDQGVGLQKAYVFVDDVFAGTWYEPDCNFSAVSRRWLDSEFMIASTLVSNKATARISIVRLPSSGVWNEYRYWVYCVEPPGLMKDSDHDQLPDEWELQYVPVLGELSGDVDSDDDSFFDIDEYIAGTDPLNSGSKPRIVSYQVEQGIAFETELGRLYTVQESTNLLSNDWNTIRSSVPGTGSRLTVPSSTNATASFYRFFVEKP